MTSDTAPQKFWRNTGVFGAATLLSGILGYFFYVILAHRLGPAGYGTLSTLTNLTTLALIPTPVLTLVYTRADPSAQPGQRRLWGAGLILWGAVTAASPALGRLFHISASLISLYTLSIVPSFAWAANLGKLQRSQRYAWVGFLTNANLGLQLLAAWLALRLAHPLTELGGWLAIVAALSWWWSLHAMAGRSGRTRSALPRPVLYGTIAVGSLYECLGIADGLLAKVRLGAVGAGWFNGLATIGHTLLYASGAIGTVMLTAILTHPGAGSRYLRWTLGIYAVLTAVALGLFYGWHGPIVGAVLGHPFERVSPLLVPYGWAMGAMGFLNILLLYAVAVGIWSILVPASLGFVLWIVALEGSHALNGFVLRTAVGMGFTLAITAALLWAHRSRLFNGPAPRSS